MHLWTAFRFPPNSECERKGDTDDGNAQHRGAVLERAGSHSPVLQRVSEGNRRMDVAFEFWFVDDGSTDGTLEALKRLRAGGPAG